MRRRVVIVNPLAGGHRLYFVRLIAEAAIRAGDQPVLLSDAGLLDREELKVHLGCVELERHSIGVRGRWSWRVALRRAREEAGIGGHIVIPEADHSLLALTAAGARRSGPSITALLMRTPRPRPAGGRTGRRAVVKSALARAASARGTRLLFLTDALGVVSARRGYRCAHPVRDPAPTFGTIDREAVRCRLGVPADAVVFVSVGTHDERKDPAMLLEAWRRASPPKGAYLLIAGQLDAGARRRAAEVMQEHPEIAPSVVIVDGYLPDADLAGYMTAADVVLLAYANDGPSGVLARAASMRRPLIAAGNPWVQQVVRARSLGRAVDLDASAIAQAISEVMRGGLEPPPDLADELGSESAFGQSLLDDGLSTWR